MTQNEKQLTRATAKIVVTTQETKDGTTYRANLRHRDAANEPENLKPCRHAKGHPTNYEAVVCGEALWGRLK